VKGIINLRGKVIPVVDMRLKFSVGNEEISERTCIIVVQIVDAEKGETLVGLIVDAVEEVINIAAEEVEENPNIGEEADNQYIRGIAKIKSEVKTLLDIDQVILEEGLDF
jgi:purine-binding chemotaxis protein CheW